MLYRVVLRTEHSIEIRDLKSEMSFEVPNNPRASARAMLIAMLIIGLIDNLVVKIAETSSLWQFMTVRMVLAIPLIALVSLFGFGSMKIKTPWRVFLRGGLLATGMFFYFGALGFMSISLALAGLFTSPIFVLLISAFLLKKRIGPRRILAVALGFIGILIVIGPNFQDLGWVVIMPVIGGFFYASGSIATRELCQGEENFAMLWAMFLVQGLFGLIGLAVIAFLDPIAPAGGTGYLLRGWVWPISDVLPWFVVQAVGSVIGVSFLIRAYQLAEASHATVFEYTIFIFGPVFAWLLFGQTLGMQEAFGIALISAAGLIIAFRS